MSHPTHHDGSAQLPRLIAWEVTRCCMLACKHCRAAARPEPYPGELSTEECFQLLDNIASFAQPIIILTGGEPMLRPDIYDLAAYGRDLGLRMVMAPCGMLINDETAARIYQAGIRHISISLDGATATSHDEFRGVPGAFEGSLRGIEAAKRGGLEFQINTTVTQHNLAELPDILQLATKLGASVFNPFLLVPTGRGKQLAEQEITPQQYEEALSWLAGQQGRQDIQIRVTCAPHYQRILRQRGVAMKGHPAKGCMGGQSFAFISHRGKVQICGFLDVECGDVKTENFDFRKIWETSEVFRQMRDPDSYRGRCGYCEFRRVCGGCRARAYALTGDYLAEEPFCTHQPRKTATKATKDAPADLDELDRKILSLIQTDFPLAEDPYEVLGRQVGLDGEAALRRVTRLRRKGVIRRLGAVFDSRSLGYSSTLVAARIPSERLEEVAETVSLLRGVTHNYRRRHGYNLWFTLTAESEQRLAEALEDLKRRTGIAEFHSLPALAVYKIRVNFQLGAAANTRVADRPKVTGPHGPAASFSEQQRGLVRLLQGDLPSTPRPFGEVARRLGWPDRQVLGQISDWLAGGVIRRFGAVLRHQLVGFEANGMAVFSLPPDRIDQAGLRIAEHPEVSHCYRRPPLDDFPYNLFAMIHGQTGERVRAAAAAMAEELDVRDCDVLFSTKEYKKESMQYFVESAEK